MSTDVELDNADEVIELRADNQKLRELLWLRHGCASLYGDDGEMQCASCGIDFKRDAPGNILTFFVGIGEKKLAGAPGCPHGFVRLLCPRCQNGDGA